MTFSSRGPVAENDRNTGCSLRKNTIQTAVLPHAILDVKSGGRIVTLEPSPEDRRERARKVALHRVDHAARSATAAADDAAACCPVKIIVHLVAHRVLSRGGGMRAQKRVLAALRCHCDAYQAAAINATHFKKNGTQGAVFAFCRPRQPIFHSNNVATHAFIAWLAIIFKSSTAQAAALTFKRHAWSNGSV